MRWHRLAAIARKELIQILRDWRSLVLVAAMPLMMTLLFGYALSIDIKHTPFYAFDREGSQRSQDLLKRFAASEYFEMAGTVDNYRALTDAIDRGLCKFGLVIPHDFSKQLQAGHPAAVQALIDATDDNTANMIVGYSEAVIDGYNGFHAASIEDWERSLERLISSPELRARLGANGRVHAAQRYAMRAYQSNYLSLLTRLAGA